MRFVVPLALLVAAAIHALPVIGVLGPARLEAMYGITAQEPNLVVLLRHRAVLFGLLATLLAYAAFRQELHRLALIAGLLSVASFLLIAWQAGQVNNALSTVVYADIVALVFLLGGSIVHVFARREA
jgi:hypothetical protein